MLGQSSEKQRAASLTGAASSFGGSSDPELTEASRTFTRLLLKVSLSPGVPYQLQGARGLYSSPSGELRSFVLPALDDPPTAFQGDVAFTIIVPNEALPWSALIPDFQIGPAKAASEIPTASLRIPYELRGELKSVPLRGQSFRTERDFVMLVLAVRIVETMFVVGAIGCVAVLALTAIEDIRTLFGLDEKEYSDAAATVRPDVTASGFGETSSMADAHRR